MQHNVGTIDRALRVIIGLGLISLVFIGPKTYWGWIGLLPLTSAFVRFCPLYKIIGISTGAKES